MSKTMSSRVCLSNWPIPPEAPKERSVNLSEALGEVNRFPKASRFAARRSHGLSMVQTSTLPSQTAVPARPFGFADVARVLRQQGRVVREVTLGFVVLVVVALIVWPSSYSTSAVVMLDPRRNNITDLSQVLTALPSDPASVQDQIQILMSRDLAAEVIERLHLAHDPEFNRALAPFPLGWFARGLSPPAQYATIIDTFSSIWMQSRRPVDRGLRDVFRAGAGEGSAHNQPVVDAYIELQIEQKSEAARRTTRWLLQRIGELGRQVQLAEQEVQVYKAQNTLTDSGQGTQSLVEQQLSAINTQLVQARADRRRSRLTYDRVELLVRSGHAADVSQVVSSPLIVQLREQQADAIRNEADLASRYGNSLSQTDRRRVAIARSRGQGRAGSATNRRCRRQ